jgi:hypothetical protein
VALRASGALASESPHRITGELAAGELNAFRSTSSRVSDCPGVARSSLAPLFAGTLSK